MKTKSLLVIPNHEMQIVDTEIALEKAEVNLIERLRSEGFHVGVAAFKISNRYSSLTGRLSTDHVEAHTLGFTQAHHSPMKKLINYITCFVKAPYILSKYDSIYAFFPGHTTSIICLWAHILRRPYGLYVRCNWLKNNKTTRSAHLILKNASFMIVTGNSFHRILNNYTSNILTEVPLTPFKPQPRDKRSTENNNHKHRLLFVGRICESKGILDILRSLPDIIAGYPDVILSIAGGGTKDEELKIRSLISSLNLSKHVELLGHLPKPELEQLYKTAHIMVFPSYFIEGFPRVLYEAMMFGLPILTCPMPGTQGFLIENIHCLYCEPKNTARLAEKLLTLLNSPNLRIEMGESNFNLVTQLYKSFNHESHADQLIDCIRSRHQSNKLGTQARPRFY